MKTRTTTHTRQIAHTVNGKTHIIDEDYNVAIPAPPRDWDHIVLHAVTAGAALLVTASVVWSTASIGDLLTLVVIAVAAYSAAVVFDLLWIMCMALEWLARYDPQRARFPRRAGHFALAVAMAAVAAHGWIVGQPIIGIVGAAVSGVAKLGWTVVMRHHAKHLDPRTQKWVEMEQAEAGGELALIPVRRQLARARNQVDAELAALQISPGADPDQSGQSADDPDADVLPLHSGAVTTKDAVRTAWDSGIHEEDAIRRCVSKALGRPVSPDTVARYVRALKVGA
ncbi:protein transporter Sec31 [Streptomyces sp. NPDC048442]|uniref:protein transporter Sec31 n=1 Tax=Streptomyces sp. NPDC048442 TaxID=3154823 RepID=UPI00342E21CD